MNFLSPSILSADFVNLERDIRLADEAGAQYIHLDVMDGHFVPPITIGADVVSAIRGITDKVLDCHLMVENPESKIQDFIEAGADIITIHAEACENLEKILRIIKGAGIKAGVAISPETPLSQIESVLPVADMILIMSVHPGYGGQTLIPSTLSKVKDLRGKLQAENLSTDIEIDGGVNITNLDEILAAGANVIVAGSAIFEGDIRENVEHFLEKLI